MNLEFSSLQLQSLDSHMQHAMRLAQSTGHVVPISAVLIDPNSLEIVAEGVDMSHSHPLGHATMNAISIRAKTATKEEYLCSGLWLLLTREPCAMCAMAAVHSRVAKVFYGVENTEVGALGSRYSIHLEPQLNHHYTVYKHLHREENRVIWDEFVSKYTPINSQNVE